MGLTEESAEATEPEGGLGGHVGKGPRYPRPVLSWLVLCLTTRQGSHTLSDLRSQKEPARGEERAPRLPCQLPGLQST